MSHDLTQQTIIRKAWQKSQKLIIGCRTWTNFQHAEGETLLRMLREGWFGGFILFSENCLEKQQLLDFTVALQEATQERHFWISIDQEGGQVARLDETFTPSTPTALELGKTQSPRRYKGFDRQAKDLKTYGINLNFSPVADLSLGSPVIMKKGRAFSRNPDEVVQWASSIITVHLNQGITPCLKHFPGHGSVPVDTHETFCKTHVKEDAVELHPFRALHHHFPQVPVMVAHLIDPAIDPTLPATLSPKWQSLFTKILPQRPPLISDDISMGAMNHLGSPADILKRALKGPMDYVIFSQNALANVHQQNPPIPFDHFPALLS